jgi:DnaJ-class molecular chaperone
MNHREILGVNQAASPGEIKQAFRNAAKEVHPDVNDSPEAAETFTRLKEAHDALLNEVSERKESSTILHAAAWASTATAQTAYASTAIPTDADIAHQQELDQIVHTAPKRSLFRKNTESDEVRRHRKKLKTNERRLRGLY